MLEPTIYIPTQITRLLAVLWGPQATSLPYRVPQAMSPADHRRREG